MDIWAPQDENVSRSGRPESKGRQRGASGPTAASFLGEGGRNETAVVFTAAQDDWSREGMYSTSVSNLHSAPGHAEGPTLSQIYLWLQNYITDCESNLQEFFVV